MTMSLYTVRDAKKLAADPSAVQALEMQYAASFNDPKMFEDTRWDSVKRTYVKMQTSPLDNPVPPGQINTVNSSGRGYSMNPFRQTFLAVRRQLLALKWFREEERPDAMNRPTRVGDIVVQGAAIGIQFGEVVEIHPNGTLKLRVFAETCSGTYFLRATQDGSHTITQQRQANTFVKVPFTEDEILQGARAYIALEP